MSAPKKVILVTGATSGIGREVASQLAAGGHRVLLHGRRPKMGHALVQELQDAAYYDGDLTALDAVRSMASRIRAAEPRLDIIIHNAAVWETERSLTEDDFERTFQVNFLAPFLLTHELEDLLAGGTVITVSALVHADEIPWDDLQSERNFSPWGSYALSKLLLIMFTYGLSRRWVQRGIRARTVHPGVIETSMLRKTGARGSPVEQGGRAVIAAALADEVQNRTGVFLAHGKVQQSKVISYDEEVQDRVWNLARDLTRPRI